MINQAQKKIKGFDSLQESITNSGFFSFDWNSDKIPVLGASIKKIDVNNDNKKVIYT